MAEGVVRLEAALFRRAEAEAGAQRPEAPQRRAVRRQQEEPPAEVEAAPLRQGRAKPVQQRPGLLRQRNARLFGQVRSF